MAADRALVYAALGGYLEVGVPERQVEPHPVEREELRDLYFVQGVTPVLEAFVERMNGMYQKNVEEDAKVQEPPPPMKAATVGEMTATVTGEDTTADSKSLETGVPAFCKPGSVPGSHTKKLAESRIVRNRHGRFHRAASPPVFPG